MEVCCDLMVDVDGQQVFLVNKKLLESFSGRLKKLFRNSKADKSTVKVIFQDFPGGVEGFELITRFCYSNGNIDITTSNIVPLRSAAEFLEMENRNLNLAFRIEKTLEEINSWSWSELLLALKQCQDLLPTAASDPESILEKILVCITERLCFPSVSSPFTPTSDDSCNFSCDTGSSDSTRDYSKPTWWFEDLLFLNIDLINRIINMMILHNFDHDTICKFLFYYRRSRFISTSQAEKCRIIKVMVNLLSFLDKNSIPCKGLFDILRITSSLKLAKEVKFKLECLIGAQLDHATLDYLLVQSPEGKPYSYDISLVFRLVKAFLFENRSFLSMTRLNKVAMLMDLYLKEVSPDPHLRPSEFAALLRVFPDSIRQSHDGLYRAIDMYLEVHCKLSEQEKLKVCKGLNYAKLSIDLLKHLSLNSKLSSVVDKIYNTSGPKKSIDSKTNHEKFINGELQCRKLHREMERKFCKIMQPQMGNVTRQRQSSSDIYLPRLCS